MVSDDVLLLVAACLIFSQKIMLDNMSSVYSSIIAYRAYLSYLKRLTLETPSLWYLTSPVQGVKEDARMLLRLTNSEILFWLPKKILEKI